MESLYIMIDIDYALYGKRKPLEEFLKLSQGQELGSKKSVNIEHSVKSPISSVRTL
jgi:hypothetical protein